MTTRGRRFEIADFAALFAGVVSIGFAIWGLPIMTDLMNDPGIAAPVAPLWLIYAGGGALAVGAVFLAQRSPGAGRAMLLVAGLVELVGVFLSWDMGWASRITLLVLAAVMLAASSSLGPVPVDRG